MCDSKILYLLSKLLKCPLPEAIPGSSFFTAFYMHHRYDPWCRIFLLGAKEGVAVKAMERINEKVGGKSWSVLIPHPWVSRKTRMKTSTYIR